VVPCNHKQLLCDRVARDPPVSPVVSKRTVNLRCFLDDLALWAGHHLPGMNHSSASLATWSGRSMCMKCPASGTISTREPAARPLRASANRAGGMQPSSAPASTSMGSDATASVAAAREASSGSCSVVSKLPR
jgi:hypothetical protein